MLKQADASFSRTIWRHIGIRLPADWELLQFSSEFNQGRCAFADRYQFRCELSWRVVRGEPDYERMVSDYMTKLEHEKKITGGERAKKHGWHGFAGTVGRDFTSRFGHYFQELGCLIEIVLLWPDERDLGLEGRILEGIEACPPDRTQAWQAFGMRMELPAAAAFEGATVLPAKAECSFMDPKTGNGWQCSRLGMLPSWFHGDLERWLRSALGRKVRSIRTTHRQRGGADVLIAEGTYKPESIHLRLGQFDAAAWIDPVDGRLYCAKKWIRRAAPGTEIPAIQIISPSKV